MYPSHRAPEITPDHLEINFRRKKTVSHLLHQISLIMRPQSFCISLFPPIICLSSTRRSLLHRQPDSDPAPASPCASQPRVPLCCACWRPLWLPFTPPRQVRGPGVRVCPLHKRGRKHSADAVCLRASGLSDRSFSLTG